jgi:hypothetical protein
MRSELKTPAGTLPEGLDTATERPPVWETLVAHRRWQRLLACLLTGNLDAAGASALRSHVRGCSACRSDLAEMAPTVAMLPLADPDKLETGARPPDALYRKVIQRIRGEGGRRRRARWRRRLLVAAAVLALAAALAAALLLLPSELLSGPAHAEQVRLEAVTGDVDVIKAQLVTHAWGVELSFHATGLDAGETYQVSFVTADGLVVPAGGVLGDSPQPVRASVSGTLPRDRVTQVLVTTATGQPVLHAHLDGAVPPASA